MFPSTCIAANSSKRESEFANETFEPTVEDVADATVRTPAEPVQHDIYNLRDDTPPPDEVQVSSSPFTHGRLP